jgi:hypothetical protein
MALFPRKSNSSDLELNGTRQVHSVNTVIVHKKKTRQDIPERTNGLLSFDTTWIVWKKTP